MKILLHVGQSKTGTSAIQAYLTLNRAQLHDRGVLYPSVTIGGFKVDLGSHNAVADSLTGVARYPGLTAEEYFTQFYHEAERIDAGLMILSAEHFFGGEPRIWDVQNDAEYFDRYRCKLEALYGFLKGHEVEILAYLRPQVDWLASAISQTIRTERLIREQPIYRNDRQFFEMAKPVLRYADLIQLWIECLHPKNVAVVPYERKNLHKGSSIADFLSRSGLEDMTLTYGSDDLQVNASLSREFIEVKKSLNLLPRSKSDERIVIACLERIAARDRHLAFYRLDAGLINEVTVYVAAGNALLNRSYMRSGMELKAVSASYLSKPDVIPTEESVAAAYEEFILQYNSLRTVFLRVDYALRAFLRTHVKPAHSAMHQLKKLYRSIIYRK